MIMRIVSPILAVAVAILSLVVLQGAPDVTPLPAASLQELVGGANDCFRCDQVPADCDNDDVTCVEHPDLGIYFDFYYSGRTERSQIFTNQPADRDDCQYITDFECYSHYQYEDDDCTELIFGVTHYIRFCGCSGACPDA